MAYNKLRTFSPFWKVKLKIQQELWNSYQEHWWSLKLANWKTFGKSPQKFVKPVSYKKIFLNINRKCIYSIWVMLKSRTEELKQQLQRYLANFVDMSCYDCSYKLRFIFRSKKAHIFIIKIFQTLHWGVFNFSFCIEDRSNFSCLQRMQQKVSKQLHFRLVLEAITRLETIK